ncbi:sulfotransferase family 2 domain-containing protein [Thalassomonas actiniarum]|uniref:Sulfotransferase family 2 domain-containing protein n=1 Tax=Thalassomonas actiniarum TaxID=485447 RepID=A0AAE9YSZ2_9GAMM|nr:sulfotransferase family 2 domain-containing protein [Thalassomonas actiniarum]WDE00531.1 sulfotransferase family 2 domain-containing protein [Thalassomonas actiniarum]
MFKRLKKIIPFSYYPYKAFMHKHKCIFVHIPKNAGSSVLTLFYDQGGRKHAKWYEFYESNDYFFRRYHKFAIVREPLARLYSAYRYCLKGGNQQSDDLALREIILANSNGFSDFIEFVLDADFLMLQLLFQPQYLYLYDRQLICKIDTVLRYETLHKDWQALAASQGYPMELPKVNAAAVESPVPKISPRALAKVYSLYRLDYQLLAYPQKSECSCDSLEQPGA